LDVVPLEGFLLVILALFNICYDEKQCQKLRSCLIVGAAEKPFQSPCHARIKIHGKGDIRDAGQEQNRGRGGEI